jgi:CheY-like chemotaxis protein
MVQSIAELMSPRAQAKGVEICVRLAREIPSKVLGDEQRLRQILFNLVGNGVKFTDQGAVAVDLTAPSPNRLRFSVRDTGPGVPKEMQARIFEEFVQADSATVKRAGGAGLGLAIVQKLVARLGGELGVESTPGQGATFWVELPVRPLERARNPQMQLAGLRVLIAAKSSVLGNTLADMISGSGGVALRYQRGASRIADVILLDHALAGGDVAEFADAPIIALIPQEDRAAIPGYQRAGVRHYLIKPVRRSSLIERILVATGRVKDAPPLSLTPPGAAPTAARVLLAEDNPINALIARTLLERAGCAVTVVENGAAAVAALQGARFDLAFLDLRMPVLDGISTARQVRAMALPAGATPLIALTADAGEADRAGALAAGMNDFVTKPIEAARIADVLARFTQAPNEAKLAAS